MKTETKVAMHSSASNSDLALWHTAGGQHCESREVVRSDNQHKTERCEELPKEETERSILKLFEDAVRKSPNSLAVKMGPRSLSYDQLNRVANRLGRSILEKLGNKIEPVALLFEHGIDGIAAIFGILKTGKFYVSLDPSFPAQRNAFILNDSQTRLIVTNNQNLSLAHQLTTNDQGVLNIDEIDNGILSDDLGISVEPESRISIGYTSGSSGTPKGVVKILRNSVTSAFRLSIRPDDRLSIIHPVSFGAANGSLFSSLLNGASLFPFDIKSQGVASFAKWLAEEKITISNFTPAVFRELAEFLPTQERLLSLRLIILTGAPITRQDFELYKKNFSPQTLLVINMSSTEAGGICSATIDHTFQFPQQGTPIGYPLAGKNVLLLDDNGHEVEPNQVGEIAIKGRIHAGYWRRPDLTTAKFLPDPSGGDERIYLTGDLGRMLPDGFYIHMGRKDFMVKIRGYRVELGEIESTLLGHLRIRSVGVAAWDRGQGEKYLVAYVVPRDGTRPTVSELHDFLMGKLPEYMIPSSYVFLESLPLTNGKLDRSQLPLPDDTRPDLGHPYAPPHTEVERSLVQIWEKILEVRPVGIHDDFFELGGHSLLASRLFIDIEKAFGKQLPLTTLFWARNVEQLARIIEYDEWSVPWSLMFPIQTSGSRPPFFWVYGETSDVLLPRYLGPDQPLYGLMHEARTGKRVLYRTIPEIAANHLKEIQKVQPQGPYYLGGFCFGGMVAFEIAQQLKKQGHEVGLLFLIDLAALNGWRSRFEQPESFRSELSRHARSFAKINVREKLAYVRVRVRDRIEGMLIKGKNLALTVVGSGYFATGRLLPPSLRLHYLSSVDHWAMRHYEPDLYPGDLILYKSDQRIYDPTWIAKFVTGKLHLRELPSGHQDLLKEPDMALWAKELRASLEKARQPNRRCILLELQEKPSKQRD